MKQKYHSSPLQPAEWRTKPSQALIWKLHQLFKFLNQKKRYKVKLVNDFS